jgi:hypothetical protein
MTDEITDLEGNVLCDWELISDVDSVMTHKCKRCKQIQKVLGDRCPADKICRAPEVIRRGRLRAT